LASKTPKVNEDKEEEPKKKVKRKLNVSVLDTIQGRNEEEVEEGRNKTESVAKVRFKFRKTSIHL
jgi:hypothetical protein